MVLTGKNRLGALVAGLATGLFCHISQAQIQASIGDVTSLKGQGTNVLIGTGLVTGLAGTGDGDQYAPSMRALAEVMKKLGAPLETMEDLRDSRNVAIVNLEVLLPETGVREGDRLDVQVTSTGAAKSLKGGRLMVTPMIYHDLEVPGVFAICRGQVILPDESNETSGVIKNGAIIEEDVLMNYLASGKELIEQFGNPWLEEDQRYFTLVINETHAAWGLATEIATTIDTELSLVADVEHVAMAMDPRNVVVLMPRNQTVAQWISDVRELALLVPEGEARVIINRKTGTIIVSGNATFSPVVVSQKGLTLKTSGPGVESANTAEEQRFVPVDPGSARKSSVSDLLIALNRLQVPIEDRIAILTEIHNLGRLHAELMFDE